METFCKQADAKTNVSLQHYVDSYKHGYGIFILWCYLTAIGVICGPLILPQQFPTHAKYPFSVERQPVKVVIYLHQSLVGLQAASGMCIDCAIAFLLFYSAARLELLARKIRSTKCERELDKCIELHDEILKWESSLVIRYRNCEIKNTLRDIFCRYTTEVSDIVRPLILTTITTTTMGVVFGSLNMVTVRPSKEHFA